MAVLLSQPLLNKQVRLKATYYYNFLSNLLAGSISTGVFVGVVVGLIAVILILVVLLATVLLIVIHKMKWRKEGLYRFNEPLK